MPKSLYWILHSARGARTGTTVSSPQGGAHRRYCWPHGMYPCSRFNSESRSSNWSFHERSSE
jgi:hypothetical protein